MNSNYFHLWVCILARRCGVLGLGKGKSPFCGQENTKTKWTGLACGVQHGTGRGDETCQGCLPFLCTRYMALERGPVEDKVGRYLFTWRLIFSFGSHKILWSGEKRNMVSWKAVHQGVLNLAAELIPQTPWIYKWIWSDGFYS